MQDKQGVNLTTGGLRGVQKTIFCEFFACKKTGLSRKRGTFCGFSQGQSTNRAWIRGKMSLTPKIPTISKIAYYIYIPPKMVFISIFENENTI